MLTQFNAEEHPNYAQKFKETVHKILPILCFSPDEIATFIAEFDPVYDENSYVFTDDQGRLTFCHYTINGPMARTVQYVLPSVWEHRYDMVTATVQQIRSDFHATNTEHELRMRIDEQIPSHSAYYAGILPGLGFTLMPRVTMRADLSLLDQLTLPELPTGVEERTYTSDQLSNYVDLFFQIDSVYRQGYSPEKVNQARSTNAQYITEACDSDDAIQTWTVLVEKGNLIGASFGGVWDDELSIEEVGILPAYYGQGLGRYLTIRCMQKLHEHAGKPGTYFGLGTDRTYTRALTLYHRLGFQIDKVESYASLTQNGEQ